jgi:aspartyl-tRNA(Asn)/glutamyl-tRNA(Gln) amidotransferase subunit C
MKITREEVVHVAHLARLELTGTEIERFAGQIGQILEYMETLERVDTGGVAPTSHAIALTNAFRADETVAHLERESVLANAPQEEDGCFVVPRVIE